MLRPLDIERALGLDFPRVRPEAWRTVTVVVHVPAFVTEALSREAFLPSDLPLDIRIEQLLVETFMRRPPGGTMVIDSDADNVASRRPPQ